MCGTVGRCGGRGAGAMGRPFVLLTAIGFLVYLANGSASPFLPLYVRSLGGSLADVGWVVGGYAVASVASNIAWGRLTDTLGRRKPLVVGAMATLMVTTSLIARAPVWWLLVPLRVLEGAAFASYNVGALAMLGDVLAGTDTSLLTSPRRGERNADGRIGGGAPGAGKGNRDGGIGGGKAGTGRWAALGQGQLLGIYRTGGSLAFAIAIVVAGTAAARYGYHATYAIAGGVYGLTFLLSLGLPEPRRAAAAPAGLGGELGELLRLARGPLLPLALAVVAWMLPFGAVYSVWPIYVADVQGLGSAGYSRLWGLAAFLEVPSMLIAGRLADRLGRRRMFALALVLFAGIYTAYALAPAPWGLVAAQVVRGFAYAAFTATALTAVVELAPEAARGRAAGVYQLASGLAQIAGNSGGAPLASRIGFPATFLGAAGLTLLGALGVGRDLSPDLSPARGEERRREARWQ